MPIRRISRRQGKAWTIPILWQDATGAPIDVAGATCRMQLRRRWAEEEATTLAPLLDLDETSGITLAGTSDPNVTTEVTATATALIPAGLYVAEWEIDLGDGVEELAVMELEVLPEVVRPWVHVLAVDESSLAHAADEPTLVTV